MNGVNLQQSNSTHFCPYGVLKRLTIDEVNVFKSKIVKCSNSSIHLATFAYKDLTNNTIICFDVDGIQDCNLKSFIFYGLCEENSIYFLIIVIAICIGVFLIIVGVVYELVVYKRKKGIQVSILLGHTSFKYNNY